MKPINLILALSAMLALSGCVTPYQPDGLLGGYSDIQLAPDVFRVIVHGDNITTTERTEDFALLRASELTLQHGFSYFAIINEQNDASVHSVTEPGHADTLPLP
jgi:hypothetical protein